MVVLFSLDFRFKTIEVKELKIMGFWETFKTKFLKWKHEQDATPVKGETYKDPPDVKDLPNMPDSEGNLIAVSSGNRELSPALSAKLGINNSRHEEIDDKIS